MYMVKIIEEWGVFYMYSWEGKHFSITDPKNVSTVVYQINETEKELQKQAPRYTACIFLTPPENSKEFISQVQEFLDSTPDTTGGITSLPQGDLAIRVLGRRGQVLEELSQKILLCSGL